MVTMHGDGGETASVENEAPALNNDESSMETETVIIPGGSAVPVPAVEDAGNETEPLCDLNLSISGSSMEESTSDETAVPTFQSLFGSTGSSDSTSGEDEGSSVALPAAEIESPHLPALSNSGSSTEMVIMPGGSADPTVEDASMTLTVEERNEAEMQIVLALPVQVENEAIHQLTLYSDESMTDEKTREAGMQIVLAETTFAVPINMDTSMVGETTIEEAGMQIVLAGSTSTVEVDEKTREAGMQIVLAGSTSNMDEKTREAGMQMVLAGSTFDKGNYVIRDDINVPLRIENAPSGSNPVPVIPAIPAIPVIPVRATTPPKRKRGRPKKILQSPGQPQSSTKVDTPSGGISFKSSPTPASSSQKRKPGRPPGTGKLQKLAAGTTSLENLTPHIIRVQYGEDVIKRLNDFVTIDQGAVCVLSAVGPVSSAHVMAGITHDGITRHVGRYNLLSICGSLGYNKETKTVSRHLSAMFSDQNTRIFGGVLAEDSLIASGVVEIVLGIFKNSDQYIKNHLSNSPSRFISPMGKGKSPMVEPS